MCAIVWIKSCFCSVMRLRFRKALAALVVIFIFVLTWLFTPVWEDWKPKRVLAQTSHVRKNMTTLLSFVMANRNDGYGGASSLKRVGNTLRALNHFAGKYNVSLELIIVEWNPPAGRPGVETTLPSLPNIAVVRVIKVPKWVHDAWSEPQVKAGLPNLPMMEFVAKNIGIRRANGQFIMGHALDTIICEAWWEDVGRHDLLGRSLKENGSKKVVFRMVRVDTNVVLDGSEPIEEWERLMGARVERVHTCPTTVLFNRSSLMGSDGKGTNLKKVLADADACSQNRNEVFDYASGDFQLVSKHDMYLLRGYVEGNTYAHFDSVFMYQARKLGFKIQGFFTRASDPDVIYNVWHQFHDAGGLEKRYSEFQKIITPLDNFRRNPFWVKNSDDWGMRGEHFPEIVWMKGVLQE
jgi:hypothetical protein